MEVEGKPVKRYRLSYGGESIDSYDTAAEALAGLSKHERDMRPLIDQNKKYTYAIADGRRTITIEELHAASQRERVAPKS